MDHGDYSDDDEDFEYGADNEEEVDYEEGLEIRETKREQQRREQRFYADLQRDTRQEVYASAGGIKGGKIPCGLCKAPIPIDGKGKEVGGSPHRPQAPPLDHGLDWVLIDEAIKLDGYLSDDSKEEFTNYCYNDVTNLKPTHFQCNSGATKLRKGDYGYPKHKKPTDAYLKQRGASWMTDPDAQRRYQKRKKSPAAKPKVQPFQ
jgi:hypothetical protein